MLEILSNRSGEVSRMSAEETKSLVEYLKQKAGYSYDMVPEEQVYREK